VQLTTGRVAAWVVAALAIGVGAFFVGHSGASQSEAPSVQAADGPHPVTLPKLTAVAPLPTMERPPKPKQPADHEAATEELSAGESIAEPYEPTVEETASPTAESTGTSSEAAAPAQESTPEPTETAPSGGGEEKLVPEG
jgi:hypothetical protein